MSRRDFEQNYKNLEQLSDKGADIYSNESCWDILCLEPYSVDLLKMQLEQERFFQRIGEHGLQGLSDQDKLSRAFHESVGAYLEEWLARYDGEELRGILLELLIAQENLRHWTGEELATTVRLPTERLTALVVGEVEQHAIRLCAERVDLDSGEDEAHVYVFDREASTAAALSIAAYAEYPELRISPNLIASVSAAAVNTARVEKREGAGEAAGVCAYMELMIAAASLVERSEVLASTVSEPGKVRKADSSKDLFKAFLALFFTDLALLLGAAAVSIVVGAAAILASLADTEAQEETKERTVQKEHAIHAEEEPEDGKEEEQEDEDESDDEWESD